MRQRRSLQHGLLSLLLLSSSAAGSWVPIALNNDDQPPTTPPPSMSHISGAFRNGTSLFIFGGCTSSCCFAPVATAWELTLAPTLDSGTWQQLLPSSSSSASIPSARFGAASVVNTQHDILYAFGGQDSSQAFLSDLWAYHHASQTWTLLPPSPFSSSSSSSSLHRGPSARAAASLSLVSSVGRRWLVLVGGFGRQGASGEVWVVDLMGRENHQKAPVVWKKMEVVGGKGKELPKRWHHVAVEDGQGGLVVVGGSDAVGEDHNEAFLLTFKWEEGTYAWRELGKKEEEDEEATRPGVRHGHVALAFKQPRDHFLVYGGMNTTTNTLPSSFLADAFRLDLASETWTKEEEEEEEEEGPGVRAYAAVGYGPGHTVVYGGFAGFTGDTDDRLLGDVWVYRLAEEEEVEEEDEEVEEDEAVRESRRRRGLLRA